MFVTILDFLKDYWTLIVFFVGIVVSFGRLQIIQTQAIKCGLRNDALTIYDKCKDKREITRYQLEAFDLSYEAYKKLNGNSFVDDMHDKIKTEFRVID